MICSKCSISNRYTLCTCASSQVSPTPHRPSPTPEAEKACSASKRVPWVLKLLTSTRNSLASNLGRASKTSVAPSTSQRWWKPAQPEVLFMEHIGSGSRAPATKEDPVALRLFGSKDLKREVPKAFVVKMNKQWSITPYTVQALCFPFFWLKKKKTFFWVKKKKTFFWVKKQKTVG